MYDRLCRYTLYLSATDQAADHALRRSSLAIVQVRVQDDGEDADTEEYEDEEDGEEDEVGGSKRPRRVISNGHTTPRNQGLFGTRYVYLQDWA